MNAYSGLCLQVHVNKNAPLTRPAYGCLDIGDTGGKQGGGGCIDLLDCGKASAAGDNRTAWALEPACTATWAQCGGSGFETTPCSEAADACRPTNATPTDPKTYMQCAPAIRR